MTGAAAPSATVDPCRQTDVVFYTTDTVRLATELSKFGSPCADYYLSVTPNATGGPRGGAPITTIRSLGPRFHALTEVRLSVWASYAATHGWYAAGVEVRRLMAAAGYDTALGDSWAINEVGSPTTAQMGIDVLRNVGTARQDLRDFVRGLHTGSGSPSAGLVFAADPLQVTTSLSQHKQELLRWYDDAPFWEDMSQYVKFWAQETYADARTWGVDGSTLAERSAYLRDYLEHGSRLAAAGGTATATAAAFFDQAYVPLANASFRWGLPNLETGIGFGYTEIELAAMQSFVSAQTYAQRTAGRDRLGYAFVPRNAVAVETLAIADSLAAAIQASQSEPAGACRADGASCLAIVAGAQFTDAWKTFTDVTAPAIVAHVAGPIGSADWYIGDATVTWEVGDAQSSILAEAGCENTVVAADTSGVTFICTATSHGGSASASVTVKRDATPPNVTCQATRTVLWPPNRQLVPIDLAVTVTDATAGAAGFTLTAASGGDTDDDLADFDVGTPDVSGSVRAERAGNEGDREYVLVYTGHDAAGNTRRCAEHIVVPHDQDGGAETSASTSARVPLRSRVSSA
jgi:hypothetical protein